MENPFEFHEEDTIEDIDYLVNKMGELPMRI